MLPCRSVECGSSTSSSCDSTLPRYQGILFLFPLLYSSSLRFFLFSSLLFSLSFSLSTRSRRWFSRVKRVRSSGQKTIRRRTVSQPYRPVISNANSPRRYTYTGDSRASSKCSYSVNAPPNNCRWKAEDKYGAVGRSTRLLLTLLLNYSFIR